MKSSIRLPTEFSPVFPEIPVVLLLNPRLEFSDRTPDTAPQALASRRRLARKARLIVRQAIKVVDI